MYINKVNLSHTIDGGEIKCGNCIKASVGGLSMVERTLDLCTRGVSFEGSILSDTNVTVSFDNGNMLIGTYESVNKITSMTINAIHLINMHF